MDRISKQGDRYLRTLLVHGARSMLLLNWKKSDRKRRWAETLKTRKPWNKVAVALADKHARILWVMLARGETYRSSRATPLRRKHRLEGCTKAGEGGSDG